MGKKINWCVSCTYDHGIQAEKDDAASAIATKFGGELLGGGTFLDKQAQRDLEFGFNLRIKALKCAAHLKKAGFENVEVLEEDND